MPYKQALPPSLSIIHPVFHMSMLKKYESSSSYRQSYKGLNVRPNLSFEEEVVQILDHSSSVRMTNKLVSQSLPLGW